MESTPRTDDLLNRHGAFLRRLAGELTRCEADAEDLVQSTWAEALRRPPASWQSPRGWLAKVARRLAGKRARTESRRTYREVRAAQAERVDADLDLSLVLGELSQALAKLDPELRRVVVARHFEGRELRVIAAAEGIALSTVKERLARAHRDLRNCLDGGVGRQRWMGAFAPLLAPTPGPFLSNPVLPAAAGALAMTATVKIVAAAGVAGLLAIGLFRLGDSATPALVPEAGAADEVVIAAAKDPGGRPKAERSAVVAETDEEPAVEPQEKALPVAGIDVYVADLFGIPATGVDVFAAPEGLPLNRIDDTNGEGLVELRWRSAATSRMVVGVRSNGHWLGGLRRFEIGPGQSRRIDLSVHPDMLPPQGLGGASFRKLTIVQSQLRGVEILVAGLEKQAQEQAPKLPKRRRPLPPEAVASETGDVVSFAAFSPLAVYGERLDDVSEGVFTFMNMYDGGGGGDGDKGELNVLIQDAFGDPVAEVEVSLRRTDADPLTISSSTRQRTGSKGRFQVSLAPGVYSLRAPSRGETQLKETIKITAGGVTNWQGVLELGTRLWGRTVQPQAEDGEGQARPIVEASAPRPGGLWIGVTRTDDKGNFSIPHCPAETLDVHVILDKSEPALLHLEGVRTDTVDWTIAVDPATRAKVTYQPLDAGPNVALASEVRVWDRRTGRGWSGPVGGRLGDPAKVQVGPGDWDLEVRPLGIAGKDSTPFSVIDARPVDLGSISMPPLGWLNLPRAEAEDIWRVERASDLALMFEGQLPETDDLRAYSLELAPGEYLVTPPGQDPEARILAIQAGHHANW